MHKQTIYANPFALMMDPQAVVAAMEGSQRLNSLQSRVCRPLDKPLIPKVSSETAAFDADVDSAEIEFEFEVEAEMTEILECAEADSAF